MHSEGVRQPSGHPLSSRAVDSHRLVALRHEENEQKHDRGATVKIREASFSLLSPSFDLDVNQRRTIVLWITRTRSPNFATACPNVRSFSPSNLFINVPTRPLIYSSPINVFTVSDEKEEKNGCPSDAHLDSTILDVCSQRSLTSSNGLHLISPLFPNEYPNNANCTCSIQSASPAMIDAEVRREADHGKSTLCSSLLF